MRALSGPIRGEGAFVMDGALYGYRVATGRPEPNGSRIKLTVEPADRPVFAEVEGLLASGDGAPRFEGTAAVVRRVPVKGDKGDVAEPWRINARVKANAASALFEQVEFSYGPDERALKLNGTAEAKFGARPRLDAVLSARTLDADRLFGSADGAKLPPRDALATLVSAADRFIGPPIPTQVGFGVDSLTLGGTNLQNIRGDIEFTRGGMVLSAFEARAPGFTQLQASGRIDKAGGHLSFSGPVSLTSTDPRMFADWMEGKPGSSPIPARPVRFRGEVTLGAEKVAIERMQAEFDRKTFDGDVVYSFATGTEPANFTAALRADELDIDAVMDTAGSLKALPDFAQPHDVSLALVAQAAALSWPRCRSRQCAIDAQGRRAFDRAHFLSEISPASQSTARAASTHRRSSGSISFNLALRDTQGLAALARRAPAFLSEPLQRAAQAAAPGKLAGTIAVEPAGSGGNSRATVSLEGPLGGVDLKLKAALAGQWSDPGKADLALDGSLDAGDVNALLKLAAADRLVSAPRQPGTYTLSLKGGLAGDLRLDSRIVSANLDVRASGDRSTFHERCRSHVARHCRWYRQPPASRSGREAGTGRAQDATREQCVGRAAQ